MHRFLGLCVCVLVVGCVRVSAALAQTATTQATSQPEAQSTTAPAALDEGALATQIFRLSVDPPRGTQGPGQVYADQVLARRKELVSLAAEFEQRFPTSSRRDQVTIAKLSALYFVGTLGGEGVAPLCEAALAILVDSRHRPSAELLVHVDYWQILCDLSGKQEALLARSDLTEGERMTQSRAFVADAFEQYVTKHPSSPRSPGMMEALVDLRTEGGADAAVLAGLTECHRKVSEHFAGNQALAMVGAKLRQMAGVGKPFEMAFTSIDGRKVDIKAMAGKVVLVDFWASWCGPCRSSMPHLQELYSTYRAKGFEIVGVSSDRRREDLDAYLKTTPLPWPTWYDDASGAFMERWNVTSLPTYFLIDKKGILRSVDARMTLDDLLPVLLAEGGQPTP